MVTWETPVSLERFSAVIRHQHFQFVLIDFQRLTHPFFLLSLAVLQPTMPLSVFNDIIGNYIVVVKRIKNIFRKTLNLIVGCVTINHERG